MSSLTTKTAIVSGNTLLSRLLGFVRDLVIARLFGADAATDAFFVAFKIPNLLRRLFAEGAFSMAFVPVLSEYKERAGPHALRHFIDHIAGTLGAALLLATLLGVLAAPLLILLFAPGFAFDDSQRDMTVTMLRWTFPYLLFISLTAFAGGILNTFDRFGVPAFTPVLLNLSLMGCAIYLAPRLADPIMALAIGVFIAGLAQLAFQLPFLYRLGLLPRPRVDLQDAGVRRVARLMAPTLFGASIAQLSLLINTLLASFLTAGSISWLYYSDRLMEFPLGILAAALGTVILPRLSRCHTSDDRDAFANTLDWALRWILLLGAPAAVGLLALAGPLMATLFHSGEFGAEDVVMASHSLMAYALGLVALMCTKILAPAYYSRQDMRTPVRIGILSLAAGLVANLVLMVPLGHTGLALGTTIGATVNAGLLLRGLMRQQVLRPSTERTRLVIKCLLATALMGGLLHLGSGEVTDWIALGTATRVLHLLGWILLGGAVYIGVLLAWGVRPGQLQALDRPHRA